MKFKIGDRVKTQDGDKGTVSKVSTTDTDWPYHVATDTGVGNYSEEHLILITPTLEDMPEGTIVIANDVERKVLFALKPGLYLMSQQNDLDAVGSIYSVKELKDRHYTIKDQESDTVEIVVEGNTKTISRQSAKELNLID